MTERDVTVPSRRLAHTVYRTAAEDDHPLLTHPLRELTISQWQDALYDRQDPLLLYTPRTTTNPRHDTVAGGRHQSGRMGKRSPPAAF
jgi:hypothetical protein